MGINPNLITPVRKSDFQNLHVDQVMTNQAMEFIQNDQSFLAVRDITTIKVSQPSGILSVLDPDDLNRDEMQLRGPTAPAEKAGFGYLNVNYTTDARSLEYDVNAAQAAGASPGRNPQLVVPWALSYKAKIHMERLLATKIFVSGNWYRVVTGASSDGSDSGTAMNRKYWNDPTNDPIPAILEEMSIFRKRTGVSPTSLRFGADSYIGIASNPNVRAQVALTVGGVSREGLGAPPVTTSQLSALLSSLMMQPIAVSFSAAIYNAANKGEARNYGYIIPSTDALLAYDAPGESTDGTVPTGFGRCIFTGVTADGMQVRSFDAPWAGPGGSQASVIDLYNGYVIVDNRYGTYFTGITQ